MMQPGQLQRWGIGEAIAAAKLNEPVDVLKRMNGVGPAMQVIGPPIPEGGEAVGVPEKFKVEAGQPGSQYALQPDFFYATRLSTGEEHIKVAKPYELRRTTSHLKAVYLSEFRVSIRYEFTSADRHNRRRAAQLDYPFITQLQMVWDEYVPNKIVNAQWLGEEGTRVEDDEDLEGVEWEDMNSAGRVWSVLPIGFLPQ